MRSQILGLILALSALCEAETASNPSSPSGTGGSGYALPKGSAGIQTYDNNGYSAQPGSGTVLHNVNMMSGQAVYSVPIAEIAMGKARFPISLTYSGPSKPFLNVDNEQAPTSWIGFGWGFTAPFVSINHKGTANSADDVFYCNLGPYGGGQLLRNPSGVFFLSTNPAVKITAAPDTAGFIPKWEFVMNDGVRMVFGSTFANDNAERLMQRYAGSLVSSPYNPPGGVTMKYRWDLAVMYSYPAGNTNSERLEFRYQRQDMPLASGATYTRESYPYEIVAVNAWGKEVEKYRFNLLNKGTDEYTSATPEKTLTQAPFETKALLSIERYLEGRVTVEKRWTMIPNLMTPVAYKKRFLDSVFIESRTTAGTYITDPNANWKFGYDVGSGHLYDLASVQHGSVREEFSYTQPDYSKSGWTTRTQQWTSSKNLAAPPSTDIVLPNTGTLLKDNWEDRSSCSERFCFVTTVGYDPNTTNETMYFEVWKNNGNYFTLATLQGGGAFRSASVSSKGSLQLIPWNDNLIVLDSKNGNFTLYEWTGETFVPQTNIIQRKINGVLSPIRPYPNSSQPMKIILGGDFFLVEEDGFWDACTPNIGLGTSSKLHVIRKSTDGSWHDLNENECADMSSCVNTTQDYGSNVNDNYQRTGARCLEYNGTSLFVSASQTMFHVVHRPTNIVMSFMENGNGSSFIDVSGSYPAADLTSNPPVTEPTHANNWKFTITGPVQSGNDFFLVPSHTTDGGNTERIDVYHCNGRAVYKAGAVPSIPSRAIGSTSIWTSGEYFLYLARPVINAGWASMSLCRKYIGTTGGIPSSIGFSVPYTVFSGQDPAQDYLVKIHPKGFAIEEHYAGTIKNGVPTKPPVATSQSGNYISWLYEYDPSLITSTGFPYRNVTSSFVDASGRNYFNLSFSYRDNALVGKSCVRWGSNPGACTGAPGEVVTFATALFTPGLGTTGSFLNSNQTVYSPWTSGFSYNYNQFNFNATSRLGIMTMLNSATYHSEFCPLQWMGNGFSQYPYQNGAGTRFADFNVVSAYKQRSGLTGGSRGNWTEWGLYYTPDLFSIFDKNSDFNSQLLNFIFPNSGIMTFKGSEEKTTPVAVQMESVNHINDDEDNIISDKYLGKVGLVTRYRIHDADLPKGSESLGQEVSRTENEYFDDTKTSVDWPAELAMTRLRRTTKTTWALNHSHQSATTSFFKYLPENNQPIFSKSYVAGKWYLTQSIFPVTPAPPPAPPVLNSPYLPTGNYSFRFDAEPSDATLDGWLDASKIYDQDGAAQKAISASQVEYDPSFQYLVNKTKLWRDVDPTLDDGELKTATDPVFMTSSGWEDRNIVSQRNILGLPLESRKVLAADGTARYAASFYEGLRPDMVGAVDNCLLSDAAILTAENGSLMPLGPLDTEGRWTWSGAAGTANGSNPHTGRYSLEVTDNPGVTTKLKLSGGSNLQSDYVISVWIYALTGNKPVITVQRYQKSGSGVIALNTFTITDPSGQSFVTKKWQRYELRLTAAQLHGSENLFATLNSGDYLQVKIGSGTTVGDGRKVDIDDVVCRPANATFALTSYDIKGRVLHVTDTYHIIHSQEYDTFGKLSAARDDRYRTYQSAATHAVGEND